MPAAADNPPRRRPRWVLWAAAWVILTLAGSALHWGSWIGPAAHPPMDTLLGSSVLKPVSNLSSVLAAPGWIISTLMAGKLHSQRLDVTLFAHGLAWLIWLGLLFTAVRVWMAFAVRRAPAAPVPAADEPPNPARRRLLVDAAFAGGALSSSSALGYGTLIEPFSLRVAEYRVPIRDLDPRLEGFRLVQIGDTHLGPRVRAEFIERAIRHAIELKPDLFALVGDYIHAGKRQIDPAAALFRPLVETGTPVVGVLGNHDWYADGRVSSAALAAVGVRMIDNARVFIDPAGRGLRDKPVAGALAICGVGDLWTHTVDARAALADVPDDMPRVLLAHNPDTAEATAFVDRGQPVPGRRVDLMLSGHTHGGQVRLPILGTPIVPSDFGQRYAHGLIQGPAFPVIVTAGIGVSLIPVRFNVPPELVLVTLHRAT